MSITPSQQQEFQSNFPLLWDFYVNSIGDGSFAHHQTMAEKFINPISQALSELFGNQFSLQFYDDLAWGALMDTDIFNNTTSLSEANKQRIREKNYEEDTNTNAEGNECT